MSYQKYSLKDESKKYLGSLSSSLEVYFPSTGIGVSLSPVYDFLFDSFQDGSCRYCSDYGVLLGQIDLEKIGSYNASKYLKSLRPSGSSNYQRHYSDEDLLRYCKSRHIQSPTEMESWIDYLVSEGQTLESDMKAWIDSQKESIDSQKESLATSSSTASEGANSAS